MNRYVFRLSESENQLEGKITVITNLRRNEVKDAIRRAVTKWFPTTSEGKEAYKATTNDYNVGDLAQDIDNPDLFSLLLQDEESA